MQLQHLLGSACQVAVLLCVVACEVVSCVRGTLLFAAAPPSGKVLLRCVMVCDFGLLSSRHVQLLAKFDMS